MINKSYLKGFVPMILICFILLGVGAVYDFTITDTLYNPGNKVCILVEAIAKFPIFAYLPVFGACMVVRNNNSPARFAVGVVLLMASWCVLFYSAGSVLAENGLIRKSNPYISGIIGGLASRFTFMTIRGMSRQTVKKIQSVCVFAFFMMVGYFGGVGGLKVLCGRDRYRDIISGGEFAFAPWYKPVFLSDGSSFPSGHTARAMGVLTLLLLPFVFEKFKDKKLPLFVLCYVYAFAVGFTRLVLGRHFLSDVAMSVLCMTVGFMILTPLFESTFRRELLVKPPLKPRKSKKKRR